MGQMLVIVAGNNTLSFFASTISTAVVPGIGFIAISEAYIAF